VSKTAGGVTTKYLIDYLNPTGFPQVIAETSSDGTMRTYTYGLERISQQQFTPNSGSPATSFYLYDGHQSVRSLANPAGAVTDTYDYDAFGNLIDRTGPTANNYLFAGEQFDPALGIYYNRARYYDQRRGRFWTMDTVEGSSVDAQTLHRYLYTRADPINRRDPSGNQDDLLELEITLEISAELDTATVAAAVPELGLAETALEVATIEDAEIAAGFADTIAPATIADAVPLAAESVLSEAAAVEAVEAAEATVARYVVTAEEAALWNAELQATIAATQTAWWEGLTVAERAEWIYTELETLMEGVSESWVENLFGSLVP